MPVEDSGEYVLGELLAERVDVDHHADDDAVVLTGRLRGRLTDVVRDRYSRVLDLVPDGVECRAAIVVDVAVVVLTWIQRQQEGLEPQGLEFGQGAPGALRIPPV